MRILTQLVTLLVALLLGAAVAVAAIGVHRMLLAVPLVVPVGPVLAVVGSLVPAWAARTLRPALSAAYCAGWLVVFGLALAGRPEGDYVVAADLRGYTLIAVAFVLVATGVSALSSRRPRSRPHAA